MKRFSTFAAMALVCAVSACAAQPHRATVDKLDTRAKVEEMLRKAEAGDVKAQEQACSTAIDKKLYKPADGGDRMCEMAAAQGSVFAMLDLSARYDIGYDRPVDEKKALYWLKRAAAVTPKKDDVMAGVNASDAYERMAEVYQYGLMGVTPDQRAAAKWRLKAAQVFNIPSFVILARMYEGGIGVKQDFKAAAKWYREAARIGGWEGAHGLALLYLKGLGVPRDMAQAYYWDSLSDNWRDKEKASHPDGVYISILAMSHLPIEQQIEIDARVREWKPDFSD